MMYPLQKWKAISIDNLFMGGGGFSSIYPEYFKCTDRESMKQFPLAMHLMHSLHYE